MIFGELISTLKKVFGPSSHMLCLMDDVHRLTARHFRYELRGGKIFMKVMRTRKFVIWSARGVHRVTNVVHVRVFNLDL